MEMIIRRFRPPLRPEEDMEWFCRALGLLGKRDRNKTGMKIFAMLVEAAKEHKSVDADVVAQKVKVTRTAALHHIRTMEDEGLVGRGNGWLRVRGGDFRVLL